MSDNQKRILEMLADKKISVDEAQRLLTVIGPEADSNNRIPDSDQEARPIPKYLRVVVQPGTEAGNGGERVNVRVPIALIRAGMKLTSLIPPQAYEHMNEAMMEKGIDFDLRNLKTEDLEELIDALKDLEVDVQNGKEKVRVYME